MKRPPTEPPPRPGREFDALLAEIVGYTWHNGVLLPPDECFYEPAGDPLQLIPRWSTDDRDAMTLVSFISDRSRVLVHSHAPRLWICDIHFVLVEGRGYTSRAEGKTPAAAVSQAVWALREKLRVAERWVTLRGPDQARQEAKWVDDPRGRRGVGD